MPLLGHPGQAAITAFLSTRVRELLPATDIKAILTVTAHWVGARCQAVQGRIIAVRSPDPWYKSCVTLISSGLISHRRRM